MRWITAGILILTICGLVFATIIYKGEMAAGHDWTIYEVDMFRQAVQLIVSTVAGGASLFVILSRRFAPKDKHWAYATMGTILGYWLH